MNTMAIIPNTLPFACLVLLSSALVFLVFYQDLCLVCTVCRPFTVIYCGSNGSAVWIFQDFDISVRCIVLTSVCRLADCYVIDVDWANYRQMLILCSKDAWGAEGCGPAEICPCVACQAQIPEHSALCAEHPAFIQSSAAAEKDRRTGEGKQSASDLYSIFYLIYSSQRCWVEKTKEYVGVIILYNKLLDILHPG